jgi:hypothetical protein
MTARVGAPVSQANVAIAATRGPRSTTAWPSPRFTIRGLSPWAALARQSRKSVAITWAVSGYAGVKSTPSQP